MPALKYLGCREASKLDVIRNERHYGVIYVSAVAGHCEHISDLLRLYSLAHSMDADSIHPLPTWVVLFASSLEVARDLEATERRSLAIRMDRLFP
jgi:hypothetical protein